MNLDKNKPNSNRSQVGMASKVWLITSGGVSNIPITKQPTITYGLAFDKLSREDNPPQINAKIKIGISKANPKANNSAVSYTHLRAHET